MSGVPVAPCTHSTGWILVHEHALPARLGERALYLSNDRPFIACCVSTIITRMMLFAISPLTNFFRIFSHSFGSMGVTPHVRLDGGHWLWRPGKSVATNIYLSNAHPLLLMMWRGESVIPHQTYVHLGPFKPIAPERPPADIYRSRLEQTLN